MPPRGQETLCRIVSVMERRDWMRDWTVCALCREREYWGAWETEGGEREGRMGGKREEE
jgi:hypothetical protein